MNNVKCCDFPRASRDDRHGPYGGFLGQRQRLAQRPVAEAILELDMRYGWQITYEDPPYVHYSDLTDVTDTNWPGIPVRSLSQLQAAQQPGVNNRTLVPKGGSLTVTLPSADPDELGAVEALLKTYNESHRGFEFAVVQGASLLHVVPRKARGLSGNLEPVKPVLDALITIEPKKRTSAALLEEVFTFNFSQVAPSGVTLLPRQ
jgi:hypothetical protein